MSGKWIKKAAKKEQRKEKSGQRLIPCIQKHFND